MVRTTLSVLLLVTIFFQLTACATTSAPKLNPDDYSLIATENVPQGYFEEFFTTTKYYKGVELRYDVTKFYPGKWSPLVSLSIVSMDLNNKLSTKVSYHDNKIYLTLQLYDGKKKLMDEVIILNKEPEVLKMFWQEQQVTVFVDDLDFVFDIPFQPDFIGYIASSIAVTKYINLIEK